MRLLLNVLSNRDHNPRFTVALANLHAYTAANGRNWGLESHTLRVVPGVSLITQGRQTTIEYAMANNFTHILWIDDDIIFSVNALETLVSKNKPVIGANYVHKDPTERRPVAISLNKTRLDSKGKTGAEEVLIIGMGFFFLDLSVLKNIPAPYFESPWVPEDNVLMCEDVYFCKKLRENGIKLHVDHDVQVGHVGSFVFQ